ncbi:MAG: Histidine--tRNA ligase [Bacteroidota bacterium]
MKPSIPKGTRDFSPIIMKRRNFIFDTIANIYRHFGYLQIETPAMENLHSLEGKYGDEGDKLLFRILNSGPIAEKINQGTEPIKLNQITEKGLRYDLTVPLARYVVMHQNDITFPFKRYQIQPVWRADRPQRGRYREFYQCDADVVGSDSLINEVELLEIIHQVFDKLNIHTSIKLNNRKILAGIAQVIGAEEYMVDITVAIDKLDKIGLDKVNEELETKGIDPRAISKLQPIILLKGTNSEKLNYLKSFLSHSEIGCKGILEIETIFKLLEDDLKLLNNIELDLTLARGLNYYTGAIIEVKVNDDRTDFNSSICGGGRYDDLTSIFGLPNVSGVGISFGVDRIYDVMEQINKFDQLMHSKKQAAVLLVNFGEDSLNYNIKLAKQLRSNGVLTTIYPDAAKMKKQLTFADEYKIPFVILAGDEEQREGKIKVKVMATGEQFLCTLTELITKFTSIK